MHTLSAIKLRLEIQQRNIGVEELTRAYLDRIEKYDKTNGLNAIAEINELALIQARKLDSLKANRDLLMFGLPVLVKDNIDVAGLHTTAGSLALSDNIAKSNSPIIENIIRNGSIVLGKTNMTEFANFTTQGMPNGYSSRGGSVKNAYDRNKDPGGSSTGSAVAVSAGFCPMAIGTDTSFSVIACATENGVVGLKPTAGSLSPNGIIPISHTLDSAGALTCNFSDALLLYSGMRNNPLTSIQPTSITELKIAVNLYDREIVSDAQLARYQRLFDILQTEGAKMSEVSQPFSQYQKIIMQCEFKHDLENYLFSAPTKQKTLENIVRFYEENPEKMLKYGISLLRNSLNKTVNDDIYIEAISERKKLRCQVIDELKEYDACVMTGPTNIMHFTGIPSVALRLCMGDDNIPRGIILYGTDERKLYAAALTIEKYCLPIFPPNL